MYECEIEITPEDKQRYGRQMLIDRWRESGQKKLKNAEVFVSGVGGLESPVSIYLAVARI